MVTKADEYWDRIGDNPLVILSALKRQMSEAKDTWVDELEQFIQDEDVNKVMDLVIQIMAGDMPESSKVAAVCARLSAYSIKFRTQYSAYMSYKKGTDEANMKKNHYKEIYTGLDRLVDSLKYLSR